MSKVKRIFVGKTKKGTALRLTPLALLLAVGVAWAAWTIIVTNGAGYGQAGTLQAPTTSQPAAAPSDKAFPGDPGSIGVRVTNPSGNPPLVISAVSGGTFVSDTPATCPNANWSTGTLATPSAVIPGNGVPTDVVLADVLVVSPSSPSTCQGQGVGISGLTYTFSTTP